MKKRLIFLLPLAALLLFGCQRQPAWIAPSLAPLRTPMATQAPQTPEPVRFEEMPYLDALLGGGHTIEGTTLRLGRDIVLNEPVYLANYEELTLDLGGHSISYEATETQTQNSWMDSVFTLDESRVTLCSSRSGGAIECGAAVIGITVMNHAALTLDGVDIRLPVGLSQNSYGVRLTDGAYAEIEDGNITADCAIFADDPAQGGTTLLINGGSFGAQDALVGLYAKDTVTAVIKGGVFRGSRGGLFAEGNPYITAYAGDFGTISDAAQSGWLPKLGGGAVWEIEGALIGGAE